MKLNYKTELVLARGNWPLEEVYESADTQPKPDFVVSRKKNGDSLSFYSDEIWDFTSYSASGRRLVLYFFRWCGGSPTERQRKLVNEWKFFLFCIIWLRSGSPLSIGTINNYSNQLKALTKYCSDRGIDSMREVLSNEDKLSSFNALDATVHKCELTVSILRHLFKLGKNITGLNIPKNSSFSRLNSAIDHHNKYIRQQHPPIPSKIFSELLKKLQKEIEDFFSVSTSIFSLARECALDPTYGRGWKYETERADRLKIPRSATFEEALISHNLKTYFIEKGLVPSTLGLTRALSEVQTVCTLIIKAYSGMRDGECNLLKVNCLNVVIENEKKHYIINGYVTKNNHGIPAPAKWVTNSQASIAIECAKSIAITIYENSQLPHAKINSDDRFLFVSAAYLLSLVGEQDYINTGKIYTPKRLYLSAYKSLMERVTPIIDEDSIIEVEKIDPWREWRSKKEFAIGNFWPLTGHQLRRSLALYASRSGLVSLPSLRRQLQHLTEEMTRYYASGSTFAVNFIGDSKLHFGVEYQKSQSESQALSYLVNVLLSNDDLLGAHGAWLNVDGEKNRRALVTNREQTLEKFKKGQLSYKETVLGGCTKAGACDKKALRWFPACLDCSGYVGKLDKLDRVIYFQKSMLNSLIPDTLEWRTEKGDLNALEKYREEASRKIGRLHE